MSTSSMWWDTFLLTYGRDSQAEKAFLGYLVTNDIPATSPPDMLEVALTGCLAFLETSAGATGQALFSAPPPPETPEALATRLAQAAPAAAPAVEPTEPTEPEPQPGLRRR